MSRRVVITSSGIVSAIGTELSTFAEQLFAGKTGARSLEPLFGDATAYLPIAFGAPVLGYAPRLPALLEGKRDDVHRAIGFAGGALQQILAEVPALREQEVPLLCGVGISQLLPDLGDLRRFGAAERLAAIEALAAEPGAAAGIAGGAPPSADAGTELLQRAFGLRGDGQTFNGTCSAATQACIQACEEIQLGGASLCIAGGHDSLLSLPGIYLMHGLGTLASGDGDPARAVKAFDVHRDGTMLGEGAAYFLFEELERALARGADILCEVVGYGSSLDGYHVTSPDPGCRAGVRMIEDALAAAALEPSRIDYVNAHGTATVANDPIEARIINEGLRGARPYVSSTKAQVGHLIAASGAVELAACLMALRHQRVPPNVNLTVPDPDCDLNLPMNGAPDARLDHVLTNSFGFGGQNTCMVLRRWTGA